MAADSIAVVVNTDCCSLSKKGRPPHIGQRASVSLMLDATRAILRKAFQYMPSVFVNAAGHRAFSMSTQIPNEATNTVCSNTASLEVEIGTA